MDNIQPTTRITVPVIALSFYAIASGYLMSSLPLMLSEYGLDSNLSSWLASAFYAGLLAGTLLIERAIARIGHKDAFVVALSVFIATILVLPLIPHQAVWLLARFVAGVAVAGIFVIVESWLMSGDESQRAKRLGVYMCSLYGGSAVGQLGIGYLGITGGVPFIAMFTLLFGAIIVLMYGQATAPQIHDAKSLSLKQISKLSHSALIGCIVSGLTLGSIYGLMPVELAQRNIAHQDIGGLMALVIMGGMAVQPMVTWLSHHIGQVLLMALFSLLGVASIGVLTINHDFYVLGMSLFVLGMATFALYPIAINLGCRNLDPSYLVSVTQVMLLCYSIGSVAGPLVADSFMDSQAGLFTYLFASLLATTIYMLIASLKRSPLQIAGE
ncbi:putative MFS family arabinose efflux permease [Vibrio crassostreae]|uniref:Putative Permease of the major facilitator superfamily n=1 Tax=Vibrio crassostreae TaxID=246167 RepID=A0A560YJX6_9VIBR|nr:MULTISPECIES: MFS transporter [Vibrio]MDH5950494.1 MFS transporter [Vibrio crassostreae]NOH73516.1 MFS transporter [Vibrio crassostreae]NOI54683.1 MFS transporter [Vibrio crassostreae]PMI24743.1 MFS transporter [Vibrio sp. 10N.286.46.E10]PMI99841.1 MFS transporter [Vibrio sp. 10N.286.45.E10]